MSTTTVGEGVLVDKMMNCQVMEDLNYRYVEFIIEDKQEKDNNNNNENPSIFNRMMAKSFCLPQKPKPQTQSGKLTGPQRLRSDVIDLAGELGCGWTRDSLDSGERILRKLSDTLWYIDHAHKRMKDNSCPVPDIFDKFQGYNEFAKLRHRPPVIQSEKLNEICNDLATILQLPSMSSGRHRTLKENIEKLLSCLTKYNERLKSNKSLKAKSSPAVSTIPTAPCLKNETACQFIEAKPKVEEQYTNLDQELSRLKDYEHLDLDLFSPSNRYKRRDYIKNLRVSKPIMLYRVAYGGSVGTINFIWSVPSDASQTRLEKNSSVMNAINEELPKFSSRQMRRDFINRYIDYVKCPKSVLRHMYFDLTGCEPSTEISEQREVNERVSHILLGSDDTKLLLDMRAMNGSETKFDEFYDEVGKYFDEKLMHVHERRKVSE